MYSSASSDEDEISKKLKKSSVARELQEARKIASLSSPSRPFTPLQDRDLSSSLLRSSSKSMGSSKMSTPSPYSDSKNSLNSSKGFSNINSKYSPFASLAEPSRPMTPLQDRQLFPKSCDIDGRPSTAISTEQLTNFNFGSSFSGGNSNSQDILKLAEENRRRSRGKDGYPQRGSPIPINKSGYPSRMSGFEPISEHGSNQNFKNLNRQTSRTSSKTSRSSFAETLQASRPDSGGDMLIIGDEGEVLEEKHYEIEKEDEEEAEQQPNQEDDEEEEILTPMKKAGTKSPVKKLVEKNSFLTRIQNLTKELQQLVKFSANSGPVVDDNQEQEDVDSWLLCTERVWDLILDLSAKGEQARREIAPEKVMANFIRANLSGLDSVVKWQRLGQEESRAMVRPRLRLARCLLRLLALEGISCALSHQENQGQGERQGKQLTKEESDSVSNNAWLCVVKLLFKWSKDSKNDSYFLEEGILDALCAAINSPICKNVNILVFVVGVLKNISYSEANQIHLASNGAIKSFVNMLNKTEIFKESSKEQVEIEKSTKRAQVVLQASAALRNLAINKSHFKYFIEAEAFDAFTQTCEIFGDNCDVLRNISRCLAKLSLHNEVCDVLAEPKLNSQKFFETKKMKQCHKNLKFQEKIKNQKQFFFNFHFSNFFQFFFSTFFQFFVSPRKKKVVLKKGLIPI